ncbi:Multidrug resistance protein 1 [Clydaea vesicula]|uniref:Multidrug resistance protein 1 n=1 Tax=Clydaea vesicula TaxID=447962 RepID=A0AAD5XSY7_9FUNG|nr:Multidrug resistance protein 1 [Clydaea vesicula]KAJ3379239.1 Multidrug resistance protein 1 [Lobulomyces angularis]
MTKVQVDNNNLELKDIPSSQQEIKNSQDNNNNENSNKKDSKDKKPALPSIPFTTILFKYASPSDKFLIAIGFIFAAANGASMPLMTIIFGDVLDSFISYPYTKDVNALNNDVSLGCLYFVILGLVCWLAASLQMGCFMCTGENITKRIREEYLKAILRQDIGWFDKNETGELTSRLTADTALIQEGISDKVGLCIQSVCTFIAGFIMAFARGWQLALVLCAIFPLLGIAGFVMSRNMAKQSSGGQDAYAEAGAVAQQTLASIRTVTAFNGQEKELNKYDKCLVKAQGSGIKQGLFHGLNIGIVFFLMFGSYSLAFWYGSTLIVNGVMTGGTVLNVFFAIIIGAFSLGNAGPGISAMSVAKGAAFKIFSTIDRQSEIDSSSNLGEIPTTFTGDVEFKNIDFHYPSREDVPILKNFSLKVKTGQTVALVGSSGSGKSTIVKLLERYYNPIKGEVLLDGKDIKSLNVKWLRENLGFVGQEPVLFSTTIKQNLLYGLPTSMANLSKEEIDTKLKNALEQANAWNFISKLPNGIDTNVGEAGGTLSGGQKQRIAIARAILSNPKILLLDEATSALDTESERIVQAAIDKASVGRTTIVIAHRLSTVRTANLIVVMREGEIVEQGTHNELLKLAGVYKSLVDSQRLKSKNSLSDISEREGGVDADIVSPQMQEFKDEVLIKMEDKKVEKRVSIIKSLDKLEEQKKKEQEILKSRSVSFLRVFSYNKAEWYLFLIGGTAALINGAVMPLFSLIFSSILTVFGNVGNPDELRSGANFWAGMFLILAAGTFLGNFLQISIFTATGEKMTRRIRKQCFESLLKQEVGFFDDENNSVGILVTKLADDAGQIKGLTGQLIGSVFQTMSTMVVGLTIAFYHGWQLTLVIFCAMPVIAAAGFLQLRLLTSSGAKVKKAYDEAGQVACEVIMNIRTVLTLTKESEFLKQYYAAIELPHQNAIKGAVLSSFAFGFSQGSIFLIYALAFYYGSRIILWDIRGAEDVMKVMFSVIFTAMAAGQAANFAPNVAKAKLAAISVFDMVDRTSRIDPTTNIGNKPERSSVQGEASVNSGKFNYPTRPDTKVLQGLDVLANPGKVIALVGPSGCGKSTVIALLERFYDLQGGEAKVDNEKVESWEVKHLRSQMALVGQEPVLFNVSIKENILYGALEADTPDSKIEEVCKMANIHDFIVSLPDGYNTLVGEKGGKLSGGQKQRIAIARALIREPKILLLDEATSALDSESEKVVQQALDLASKGRTTLVIAHRLSTIQNADLIYVVNDGKVIESGKHFELLEKKGVYYELVNQQNLGKTE